MTKKIATKLSVNLNKVALLRNQRDVGYPSVLETARLVVGAGAHGITIHPRPDERHIRRSDALQLQALIASEFDPAIEFNIEGYPTTQFLELVNQIRPTQVTLVPDSPDQRTSDHGWNLDKDREFLAPIIERLQQASIRVSLFVDPSIAAIEGATAVGSDRIELYTEPFAAAFARGSYARILDDYVACANLATNNHLGINAGHDLTIDNTRVFRAALPMLAEVSIGHAITADALRIGFPAAVQAYLSALE